jgi:high-affinity nickel-transport protein
MPRSSAIGARSIGTLVGMGAFILTLHVLGWGTMLTLVVPQQLQLGASQVFGLGLGVTAYTLGMRHAFDADHIAAIDNATRKQLAEGGRPLSVGFWFSLGHSTIVFVLVALLAAGVGTLAGQVADDSSLLQQFTGLFGTVVSGVFLLVIGLVNLIVLAGLIKVFARLRSGRFDEAELEAQLQQRGPLARMTGRATELVTKPWHMYPVGLLFGLGFDTATEIGLLVIVGGAAAVALPWYAILTLPVLFAAGMCLLDTLDGALMFHVYGWASARPVRKVFYNLTVTGLSVAVAFGIGGIELAGVLADRLGITSGPLAVIASVEMGELGYLVVALFLVTWLVAVAVWKLGRVEERWSSRTT